MKKALYILGALAILMAGCSKDVPSGPPDPDAWMYDVSLPVPIRFAAGSLATKAAIENAEDMEEKRFAFIAVNKDTDDLTKEMDIDFDDNIRGDCKLEADGKSVKFRFMKPNALPIDKIYYYPMNSDENYSFYGYHTEPKFDNRNANLELLEPKCVREKDRIYVDLPIATNNDVLWGAAIAEKEESKDPGYEGIEYDGYNASYIRRIGKNPHISFEHPAARLVFKITRTESLDGDKELYLKLKYAYLDNIPKKARLCLVDIKDIKGEDIGNSGNFIEVVETGKAKIDSNKVLTVKYDDAGNPIGTELSDIFIMPQDEPLKLRLVFNVGTDETEIETVYEIDPKKLTNDERQPITGFERAKKYYINLIVYSPIKVEFTASVSEYDDAFEGGGYFDPIDPDKKN